MFRVHDPGGMRCGSVRLATVWPWCLRWLPLFRLPIRPQLVTGMPGTWYRVYGIARSVFASNLLLLYTLLFIKYEYSLLDQLQGGSCIILHYHYTRWWVYFIGCYTSSSGISDRLWKQWWSTEQLSYIVCTSNGLVRRPSFVGHPMYVCITPPHTGRRESDELAVLVEMLLHLLQGVAHDVLRVLDCLLAGGGQRW